MSTQWGSSTNMDGSKNINFKVGEGPLSANGFVAGYKDSKAGSNFSAIGGGLNLDCPWVCLLVEKNLTNNISDQKNNLSFCYRIQKKNFFINIYDFFLIFKYRKLSKNTRKISFKVCK